LRNILIANKIKKVYVVGLAFDYCVGNTALDALKHGHETYVLMDCTRSVASDSEKEMKTKLEQAGCKFITSEDLDKYI
jgi:nicotinamidase/pyrazinamidase